MMRAFLIAACLGVASFGFVSVQKADAHDPVTRYGGHSGGRYHDATSHWHKTNTIVGPVYWYGNGLHDYLPHGHRVTPWGDVRSYSLTPLGPTTSYQSRPYYYGGYGGYNGYRGYYGRGW